MDEWIKTSNKKQVLDLVATDQKAKHWVDYLHSPFMAWFILAISFVITFAAWKISTDYAEQRAHDRFKFLVDEAELAIKKRMLEYEQMLRGGVGLFEANKGQVTRTMWRQYVTTLEINNHFPGVQGVGFSQWIPSKDLKRHIDSVQAEGFPEYVVKPEGERDVYTSIIYLEPFADRNLRAFGFDMFSEATRREAMTRARDTGLPALSGRVTLKQETSKDVQPGFLMYMPVYARPVSTVDERRAALLGFVYSPFRINDLMEGILGGGLPELSFDIYDGDGLDKEKLLYDSDAGETSEGSEPSGYGHVDKILVSGHSWTVNFEPTDKFTESNAASQPLIIAIGGIVIDILLFMIIMSISRLRRNAVNLAEVTASKLDKRELHFKAIADTANDGIISTDSSGLITYFNKGAEKIFGYDHQEVIGKPIAMLMPERYQKVHGTNFEKFIKTGVSDMFGKSVELYGRRKDGVEFPIELSLSHWIVGEERFVNAIVRDITERKKIERMKNEFISTVSHELRTPLTSIRGSLGLMAGGIVGELNQQTRGLLDIANANIERLSRLINDILDIEGIESNQLKMEMGRYRLNNLLQQALETNKGLAEQKNIALKLENMAMDNVEITVDNDRFLQIMTNLIGNAVKFSPSGEEVVVRAMANNDRVRIMVEDHGPGIPDEFRSRIFGKFAQADSSDTRLKGGTGLGLSICKALAERFGGLIGYESTVGKGTTFYIDLPVSPVIDNNRHH